MRALKLFRRTDARPPLKDRLASLKARLGRVARRPDDATDPQRRVVLAASIAAALPLPALAGGGHPDAELLAIGCRLDAAVRTYLAVRPAYEAAQVAGGAAITEALKPYGPLGDDAFLRVYRSAIEPFDAEIERGESILSEIDRLSDAALVAAPPPTTLAGLAVLARVVAMSGSAGRARIPSSRRPTTAPSSAW